MSKDYIASPKCYLSGSQSIILDCYRIIAAYLVLFGHSCSFYQCTVFKNQERFMFLQNIGVVILFLLSGFLTAMSLEKNNEEHKYSYDKFVKHKIIRISREYIPALFIIAIIDMINITVNGGKYLYHDSYNVKQFIGNIFMLQNMGPNAFLGKYFVPFGSARVLWTLSVEWWLYMLYGALYLLLSNKRKANGWHVLVFLILVFMSSAYLIKGRGAGLGFVFFLGVLAYYSYDFIEENVAWPIFIGAFILYIIYGLIFKEAYTEYSFIILFLLFSSTIKIGESRKKKERNRVIAFISGSTFMLYLIHYSIIDLIVNNEMISSISVKYILGICCSVTLSMILYWLFGVKKNICTFLFNRYDSKG